MQTEEENPFAPTGITNWESVSQPSPNSPCSPPATTDPSAAAWDRPAHALTPQASRGLRSLQAHEQRQVSSTNPRRAWRVPCQAPPTMQSQGPTPGHEDRVRAAKGFPYVGGGVQGRFPPSRSLPCSCLRATPPRAGLVTQLAPDGGLSWHSHLLRRQLCFHVPKPQCCGPRVSDGQGQGQLPRGLLSTHSKGPQPCPLHDQPCHQPFPLHRAVWRAAGPTPPAFVFGRRLQKEPMTPLV